MSTPALPPRPRGRVSTPPTPGDTAPKPASRCRPVSGKPVFPPSPGGSGTVPPAALPPSYPPPVHDRHVTSPTSRTDSTSSGSSPPQQGDKESFGLLLQTSFDAINKRHDEEVKALESLRIHIHKRLRADAEYATTLGKINQQANRSVSVIAAPPPIVQAWLCFLDMADELQKKVCDSATRMNSVLKSVDKLIIDKKGAKRAFDSNKNQLDKEFHSACNDVQSIRRKYREYINRTDMERQRLETALQKQPPKPADQERARKKFVYNAEKLHNCHNVYSLSIINANTFQTHFRNSMLPFALDTLQKRMELQVSEWKDAMLQYAEAMDFTQTYEQVFQKFYSTLRKVDKDDEYLDFVQENKSPVPQIEFFEFDVALLDSNSSPANVKPGKVLVDNLTDSNIRSKMETLEKELNEHKDALAEKKENIGKVNDELSSYTNPDEVISSPTKETPEQPPPHVVIADLKAKAKELEFKIENEEAQLNLIKEAVQALGDATPPLFDPLGEGVDLKDLGSAQDMMAATATSASVSGNSKLASTLKKRYRGLKEKMKHLRDRTPSGSQSKEFDASVSLDSSMSGGGSDERRESTFGSDTDLNGDTTYDIPPELPVEDEPWYYGNIDRREADMKCKNSGDYLVRHSARNNKYVLTVNWTGQGKHFVIQELKNPNGGGLQYRFEGQPASSIHELLEYHVLSHVPITAASGAIIMKPVSRFDKWSMQHEDIKMGKKLGRGAFGEVWEATLLTENIKVAVKTCRSTDLPDKDKFLQEAEILKQYHHPNIVRLIGICCNQDPVYIVMELMPGGSFLDFLRHKGIKQTKLTLNNMCTDACRGMEYLEGKNCIHRDLAARNCLVGDNDSVKISDFGMSREDEGGVYMVSSGTRAIPIKWTAPEALNYGKYTSASDVWSFGILLWEAFSCGAAPYPGMNNNEARNKVENNYRMPAPSDCPEMIYSIMMQCWQYDEEERPNFSEILQMLQSAAKSCS